MYTAIFKRVIHEVEPDLSISYRESDARGNRFSLGTNKTNDFKSLCFDDGKLRPLINIVTVVSVLNRNGINKVEEYTFDKYPHLMLVGDFVSIKGERLRITERLFHENQSIEYALEDGEYNCEEFIASSADVKRKISEIAKMINS